MLQLSLSAWADPSIGTPAARQAQRMRAILIGRLGLFLSEGSTKG